jgi:hypothetical protein
MIDFEKTFDEIKGRLGLTCGVEMDARALVFAADSAMRINAGAISCSAESVNMLWTWLEKSGIKIYARINVCDDEMSAAKLTGQINSVFKKGAHGVQLDISPGNFDQLAQMLMPVATDLFFGKELVAAIDLDEVQPMDWGGIFHNIKMLNAVGLCAKVGKGETAPGAIYGMLNALQSEFRGGLHIVSKDFASNTSDNKGYEFIIPNMEIIENIWRLVQKICPETLPKTMFFI